MIVLYLLHLLGTPSRVTSQDWPIQQSCEPCRCSLENSCSYGSVKHVDCSRLDLKQIPTNLPKDLDVLDLSFNQIDNSSINVVCDFKFLQILSLAYNPFTSFDESAFIKCSLLVKLNLTGSSVLHLSRGSFLGLDNVREIYGLRSNFAEHSLFEHLTSLKSLEMTFVGNAISEHIFTGLQVEMLNLTLCKVKNVPQRLLEFGERTLQILYIHGPHVKSVHADLFRGLRVLRHVSLHLPELSTLPERLLRNLGAGSGDGGQRGLREIVLGGMHSIPRHVFDGLEGVLSLDIHDVQDVAVGGLFDGLVNLEMLNLTGCRVVTIPPQWFAMLYSLKTLNISNTSLRILEQDTFQGLINLRNLDLSSNGLRTLRQNTFEPLSKSIRKLKFRSNMLKTLDEGVLRNMFSLQYLDLSDNKLSEISPNAFVDLKLLGYLQLQENKLYSLPKDLFRNQHRLQVLRLGNNHFTSVPLAARRLTNFLRFLYLSNNKITTILPSLHISLPYLKYFALKGNPIHCQCQIFSLRLHVRRLFIDAFCEAPRQYFRKHVMSIAIPDSCLGPKPEVREIPHSSSSVVPSFLQMETDNDYNYDASVDYDFDADYNKYMVKITDNFVRYRLRNMEKIGEKTSPIPDNMFLSSMPKSTFNRKSCHLLHLHGSFTPVNPSPPTETVFTTPLPSEHIAYSMVTGPHTPRETVAGGLNTLQHLQEDLASSPLLSSHTETPKHTTVSNVETGVLSTEEKRLPASHPMMELVIEEIKVSDGETVDYNEASRTDVTSKMNLKMILFFLPVPLVLACVIGLGAWWQVVARRKSLYEINPRHAVGEEHADDGDNAPNPGETFNPLFEAAIDPTESTDL